MSIKLKFSLYFLVSILLPSICQARFPSLGTLIKVVDAKCKSTNPQQITAECLVNNTNAILWFNVFIEAAEVYTTVKIFRKEKLNYIPFVLDINLDWCAYNIKPNNPIFQRIYSVLEKYTNFAGKCPIKTKYKYFNMFLQNESIRLPFGLPVGEYRSDITVTIKRAIQLYIHLFAEVV